jgi:hypothetical protein
MRKETLGRDSGLAGSTLSDYVLKYYYDNSRPPHSGILLREHVLTDIVQ